MSPSVPEQALGIAGRAAATMDGYGDAGHERTADQHLVRGCYRQRLPGIDRQRLGPPNSQYGRYFRDLTEYVPQSRQGVAYWNRQQSGAIGAIE